MNCSAFHRKHLASSIIFTTVSVSINVFALSWVLHKLKIRNAVSTVIMIKQLRAQVLIKKKKKKRRHTHGENVSSYRRLIKKTQILNSKCLASNFGYPIYQLCNAGHVIIKILFCLSLFFDKMEMSIKYNS